jgi:hypothetical protein
MNHDLEVLKQIAQNATQGEWLITTDSEESYEHGIPYSIWPETLHGPKTMHPSKWAIKEGRDHQVDEISELSLADADHIATFDPPTVLALLARIEELEAENERLKGRRRDRRRDSRKSLIEQMQETPEGRQRLAEAHYSIAYEDVEDLEAAIQRVRELHTSGTDEWVNYPICTECFPDNHGHPTEWPCPTIQALGGPK